MQQKNPKSNAGRILMTIFLFFALFGITFGLSIILFSKNKPVSTSEEVIPEAEIKLPINSPTKIPEPSPILVSKAKVGEGCKVGGCNNEICLNENDEVATSICLYQEKFVCYQTAKCEKQGNEKCDWTKTPELSSCLKENEKKNTVLEFCGGIAGVACKDGFTCKLDGNYPDAGGECVKN